MGDAQVVSEGIANHPFSPAGEREAARVPSDGTSPRRTKEGVDDRILGLRIPPATETGHAGLLHFWREQRAKCPVKPAPHSRIRQAESVARRDCLERGSARFLDGLFQPGLRKNDRERPEWSSGRDDVVLARADQDAIAVGAPSAGISLGAILAGYPHDAEALPRSALRDGADRVRRLRHVHVARGEERIRRTHPATSDLLQADVLTGGEGAHHVYIVVFGPPRQGVEVFVDGLQARR